jgi:hypothetical protein
VIQRGLVNQIALATSVAQAVASCPRIQVVLMFQIVRSTTYPKLRSYEPERPSDKGLRRFLPKVFTTFGLA